MVGLFLTSLWIFSALIKILNSTWWIKWTHTRRFNITNVLFVIGYLIMTYTYSVDGEDVYGFWVALFGTLVIGLASSFGESVNLGTS